MIEIIAVKLDNAWVNCKFNKLLSYLSNERKERISRFYRFEDAQRTLIGDILIRFSLCRRFNLQNKDLLFGISEYGKPFLVSNYNIHYNISHSGEWVVCCLDNLEIGIDIEQIISIDMDIANQFFAKDEVVEIMSKKVIEREDYFYDLWTLKESYIKAIGKGLSIPLDSFAIKIDDNNITVSSIYESENYHFKQYFIDKTKNMQGVD